MARALMKKGCLVRALEEALSKQNIDKGPQSSCSLVQLCKRWYLSVGKSQPLSVGLIKDLRVAFAELRSSGRGLLGLGERREESCFALLSWVFIILYKIFFEKCYTAKRIKLENHCPWWSLKHLALRGHQEISWTTQAVA